MTTRQPCLMLKRCQKCSGDLCLREDRYGRYWQCLQCGEIPVKNAVERTPPRIATKRYGGRPRLTKDNYNVLTPRL